MEAAFQISNVLSSCLRVVSSIPACPSELYDRDNLRMIIFHIAPSIVLRWLQTINQVLAGILSRRALGV